MVLVVGANARELDLERDAEAVEEGRRADARMLQDADGADCARGEDDFFVCGCSEAR